MAGVPGASFVVLLASVSTIGVPMAGLTFIAGIDRFVDMGRTAVNVVGNSICHTCYRVSLKVLLTVKNIMHI